jgi:hypothetical protein
MWYRKMITRLFQRQFFRIQQNLQIDIDISCVIGKAISYLTHRDIHKPVAGWQTEKTRESNRVCTTQLNQ